MLQELEREIGRFCFELYSRPISGRLLVLAGPNGCGKTHCAKAVLRWVQHVGPSKQFVKRSDHVSFLDVIYWSWPELLDNFKTGGWDCIEDMNDVALLIIDELGGGYDPSFVGVDKLCQVLSRREKKWTLITTNILPSSWEELFDRRIASRLVRNGLLIDLSAVPDFANVNS